MTLKNVFCGKGKERVPAIAFRMMSFMIELKYIFLPLDARIDTFGIKEGFTVIDYGCGPGGYLKRVSRLIGETGKLYAVDMFHMIKDPVPFLQELHRLLKPDGVLIIDDGHQSRTETKMKMNQSKLWNIATESKDHLKCTPI